MHDSVPDAAATTAESGWSIRQQLTLGSAESAFSLIRAGMLPGVSVKNRTGHGGEILIVIYGKAAVTIGGSTKDLSAGHALSISGSVEYAITANDDPLEIAVVRWASGHVRSINGTLPQSSVRALDRANMEWAYEMYLSPLFDAQQISGLPFGSSYGSVPPQSTSKYHCHQDSELLLILGGEARISLGEEIRPASPGDFAVIPPFLRHAVQNIENVPVDLISIYWDDPRHANERLSHLDIRDELPERTIIFCPPPTPNGGLHIGHIAGPYIRADIFARALRTVGKKTDLVVGTDDHQSYVAVAAKAEGIHPSALALREGDRLASTLSAIGFDAARVYRPEVDLGHEDRIRKMLDAVLKSSAVTRADVETPWCGTCDISLYQAFAGGYCPVCSQACDGEICEECGHPNSARGLRDLVCQGCGGRPQMRMESTLLLDLQCLSDQIIWRLRRTQGSANLRLLAEQLIAGGLDPYRISRWSRWGIALSAARVGEVIDPWVELALTQLDSMQRLKADDTSAVSFLGFDNSFYYAILLPALAFAANQEDLLPEGYVVNYFLHLDGAKISTSRNHAIWVDDLLDKTPADAIRLALTRRAPEEAPGNVETAELVSIHDDPLITRIQRWLAELAQGPVPGTGAWTVAHREFYRRIGSASKNLDALLSPETFTIRDYICQLDSFTCSALSFRAAEVRKRLLPGMSEEARTSVALEYLATKSLAAFVYPIMPELGGRMWAAIGLQGVPFRERELVFLPSGTIMQPVTLSTHLPADNPT